MLLRLLILGWGLVSVACGGAPRTPYASRAAGPTGAAAFAGDSADDLSIWIDLAAMRKDPVFAKVLAQAEASASAETRELLKSVDRIDARVGMTDDRAEGVIVAWGRLPTDPQRFEYFRDGGTGALGAAKTLPSGVREHPSHTSDGGSVFVVRDEGWVLAAGSTTDSARSRLSESASLPVPARAADLLHMTASPRVLTAALSRAGGSDGAASGPEDAVEAAELRIAAGTLTADAMISFLREDEASGMEKKLAALAALAAVASAQTPCKALSKLSVDVRRDGRNVNLSIKGIADAAEAWDPATCPKLGGGDPTAAVATPGAATEKTGTEKICPLLRGKKVRTLRSGEGQSWWPRERSGIANDVLAVEKVLTWTARTDRAYSGLRLSLAQSYAEWLAGTSRACDASPNARGTAEEMEVARQIAPRMDALCREIAKDRKVRKDQKCR